MALLWYLDMNSYDTAFITKVIFLENEAFLTKKGQKRIQFRNLCGVYGVGWGNTPQSIKLLFWCKKKSLEISARVGSLLTQPIVNVIKDWNSFLLILRKLPINYVYVHVVIFFPLAPSQAPSNIMWIQDGSHVSLGWEPVRPLANESDVMGYKVSASPSLFTLLSSKWLLFFPVGFFPFLVFLCK